MSDQADLVVRNAKVTTLAKDPPGAESLAVSQGLVQAVGTDRDISVLVGPSAKWKKGQMRNSALATILLLSTKPNERESVEWLRLSPITKY